MTTIVAINRTIPWNRIVTGCLVFTLFALPLSSSGKSIGIVLALLSIMASPSHRRQVRQSLSMFWCQASMALFGLVLCACFWGPATLHDQFFVMEKYSKLLYLPLLAVGFRDPRTRFWSLHAFVLAMLITCFFCLYKEWYTLAWGHHAFRTDSGAIFRNHIITGSMAAFAAYITGMYFFKTQGVQRVLYALVWVVLTTHVLLINTGRTGYVIYGLLMFVLVCQTLNARRALLGFVAFGALFLMAFEFSPVLHTGLSQVVSDWKMFHKNQPNTSIGARLTFHQYAKEKYREKPVMGQGTASFTSLFAKDNPLPSWNRRLWEPHSQYWLMAAEFGFCGILLFLVWCVSLMRACWQLSHLRSMGFALIASFMLGSLTDSLLFYSGTGYFFILMMAICLGELHDNVAVVPDKYSPDRKSVV